MLSFILYKIHSHNYNNLRIHSKFKLTFYYDKTIHVSQISFLNKDYVFSEVLDYSSLLTPGSTCLSNI